MEVEKAGCFAQLRSRILTLMNHTPSSDRRTAEQYAFYERRIRGLSTAIWLTQIQPLPLSFPPREPRVMRVYRAIATLLTTDSNEAGSVTVTGAPDIGSSLHLTIVAPRVLNSSSPHTRFHGQNRAPLSGKPPISVERISLHDSSSRRIHGLPERTQFKSTTVDIVQHTADVFQSLNLLSQSRNVTEAEDLVCRFILSRCWAEVKARLDASRSLLQFPVSMTLTRVLRGWSPRPEDASSIHSSWQDVRNLSLTHELQQERIPIRENNRETQFYFGLDTASRWIRTLCKTVDGLKEATERYASNDPSGPHLTMMVEKMKILAHLLNTAAVQSIFNSRSLHSQLDLLHKRPHVSTTASMMPTCSMISIIEDERKYGETSGRHILRYLSSLVSWYNAATVDLANMLKRLAQAPPILYVIKIPVIRPQERPQMHSPFLLARAELNKFLSRNIEHAYTRRELEHFNVALEELFPRSPAQSYPPSSDGTHLEDFFGIVHNASVSLAVMNGDSSYSSPDPTSPHWVPIEERPQSSRSRYSSAHNNYRSPEYLVKPPNGGFATSSKQCCYCCNLLEEILCSPPHRRSGSGSDTSLEPTSPFRDQYGVLVPWTPPPLGYGLSIQTLARIERELKALLLGGILDSEPLERVFSATNEAREQFDEETLAPQGHSSHYSPPPPPSRLSTVFERSENSRLGHHSYRNDHHSFI
ncbi:hypothetical protein GYMLUDRAFT_63362 [Collybiopsis luxurians FD-317 M1]|uniref:Uncharacterized protein n=1 Tax=Collybiopsis luxurians FD-317 M1 TaxID=944289 RepID=A0A0D0CGW2_9AGAR|nr:hypothetical protein GYMLUDRAFT_63362 [Collybiopsis luxurians FD-317 M1]